jgi:alpha-glucosidase
VPTDSIGEVGGEPPPAGGKADDPNPFAWETYSGLWTPADDWRGQDVSRIDSSVPTGQWLVGDFAVTWNANQGHLMITPATGSARLLWASRLGRAFLLAGRGKESVSQWRGSFTITDEPDGIRCREQWIDHVSVEGERLVMTGTLSGPGCGVGFEMSFAPVATRRLRFDVRITDGHTTAASEINRIFLVYDTQATERFYGFGEQFTYFDLKGRAVPILSQEQGHLRGRQPGTFLLNKISPGAAGSWATTYAAVPQYITSQNRALLLEDSELSVFNLIEPERVEVRLWSNRIAGQILAGNSPLELIEVYTEYAGRMPPVPDWFHSGAIVGIMGGSAVVRDIHARLEALDAPIAAYWIQDWVGKRDTGLGIRMWWNWNLDRGTYPDWEALVGELNAEGIEVLGYVNPFLSDASGNPSHARNLFEEARQLGYLTTWSDGEPAEIDSGGFTGTLVDLSNPAARRWLKDVMLQEMIGRGMRGWMADFGEALPFDAQLASGIAAASFHNRYPETWAALNREVLQEAGLEGDAVVFLRGGFTRSPAYATMFWLGDQMVTWDEHDGLKSTITGMLSGGMAGYSLNHSDIGGLIAMRREVLGIPIADFVRTEELFMRWAEMNAFTTAYRTHEGNNPKVSHQFYSTDESLAFFVRFAKVFAALAPYRRELFAEAAQRGYPVCRHPLLHYPDDPEAARQRYQFMLGPDFMVAPVTEPETDHWQVYLPPGRWVHLWSGIEYGSDAAGQYVEVPAPLGEPPVFFRGGSTHGWNAYLALQAL